MNRVYLALLTIGLVAAGCSNYQTRELGPSYLAPNAPDQEGGESSAPPKEDLKEKMRKDKTGTNPINFTHDVRLYNEYQFLNVSDDGTQNIMTMEFRTPFADGKWQFRMRGRYQWLDIDGPRRLDLTERGFGDFDFRFLTVPYINMKKRFAVATGFEAFLPTATEPILGTGALSVGPQVFAVFFAPFGIKQTLVVPAYQHKFTLDKEEDRATVHQGLIDLFMLWISSDRQYWFLINPQAVLDYEFSSEFMLIDAEAGTMLERLIGLKGHSVYIRPSVGLGVYRPTDGSIEAGYKIIW